MTFDVTFYKRPRQSVMYICSHEMSYLPSINDYVKIGDVYYRIVNITHIIGTLQPTIEIFVE